MVLCRASAEPVDAISCQQLEMPCVMQQVERHHPGVFPGMHRDASATIPEALEGFGRGAALSRALPRRHRWRFLLECHNKHINWVRRQGQTLRPLSIFLRTFLRECHNEHIDRIRRQGLSLRSFNSEVTGCTGRSRTQTRVASLQSSGWYALRYHPKLKRRW